MRRGLCSSVGYTDFRSQGSEKQITISSIIWEMWFSFGAAPRRVFVSDNRHCSSVSLLHGLPILSSLSSFFFFYQILNDNEHFPWIYSRLDNQITTKSVLGNQCFSNEFCISNGRTLHYLFTFSHALGFLPCLLLLSKGQKRLPVAVLLS